MAKDKVKGCSPMCLHLILIVLGALVLLNNYYSLVSWPVFIGGLLILKGAICLVMPKHMHCK